jgi:hypothetical protein
MKDMSIIRVEPIPDLDDLFTRSMAACEKHQVSANDLEIREIARRHLMGLSRDLIGVFGRDREPDEFTMFVDHWYRLSKDKPTGAAPKKYHRWFAYYLRTVRTAPGEVWRMALAAIGDESLSVGLPDSITSHDRANRAARLLRGLNRFHKGAPFFLSFARIKSALGLPSNAEAGRVCFRLEKAGLVERLDHGTPFDPDLAPEDRRATTWLWHGPK